MSTTQLLSGIDQHTVKTDRLAVTYLKAGTGSIPTALVHGNCSSSLFFQDFMLSLAATGRYTVFVPDMRGFGDSEVLPVDGTRGLRDFSDDLDAFTLALDLNSFKFMNQGNFANINIKPPVLWVHGSDDQIVCDTSLFDFGFLGQSGGEYREVQLADCGHSPHIEKQEEVLKLFTTLIDAY